VDIASRVSVSVSRPLDAGGAPPAPQLAARTIQILDLTGRSARVASTIVGAGLGRQFTIAAIGAGGTLVVGYIVWLLVNYSLARHTLIVMPQFDPMDVHCLLRMAARRGVRQGRAA
jgi:hypothetical protein